MRHELIIGGWVITSDNSAAIGEKPLDAVAASDHLTAKFAARVALLEQWAAGSEAEAVLVHNFSGENQWHRYIEGIQELFTEVGLIDIPITGSSETNMETLQSGVAVTIFGKPVRKYGSEQLEWFAYGVPLVGNEVLEKAGQIADLKVLREGINQGFIERVWPVGSKGIAKELELVKGEPLQVSADIDVAASGGPAACVLIGVRPAVVEKMKGHVGNFLFPLSIAK